MKETANAFFMLDDHATGGAVPAGKIFLKGWVVGKPGCFITDLRVIVGTTVHPACFGHPRPDLAQYFKAREPFLLAGFDATLPIVAGENHLRFEACEISGRWTELDTVVFNGAGDEMPPVPAAGTLQPHEFARALRLLLQKSVGTPTQTAAEQIANFLPLPHVTRYAAVPFHGHLHNPPQLQRTEFGRVIVEGWLFHETQSIRRIAATVDLQAWQIMEKAGDFPYVAGLFPQFPNAAKSRFYGTMDVPAQLPLPASIRIYAELEDGSWHLCHVERSHFYDDEQSKAPYPRFSLQTFFRSARALRSSCQRRGFKVLVNSWFLRALREVWAEYRARSPRPTSDQSGGGSRISSASTTAASPARVALITHNLNFEGAPLFLLEYAKSLAHAGSKLTVISANDGPLRKQFEGFGAEIEIVEIGPLLKAGNTKSLNQEIVRLGRRIDLSQQDLVVANTLSTYWAVHLAHRANRPSLFYIHESTTPDCFYFGYMAPATLPVVKKTFSIATHVSFLTEATRRYYRPYLTRFNSSINPGWIDLSRIDQFVAAHPRATLRKELGLIDSTRLVVNIGTVCNRKGQHIFVRAVDLLWRRHPDLAAQCEFLMVGGRDSAYDHAIRDLAAQLNRPNLRIVGETATPEIYYGAADLFVCSSYEESFPRVVLEAMAFAVPIVSTNVHGIPEMTRDGEEAVLVAAGDSSILADAQAVVLGNESFARALAKSGRARVAEHYDAALLMPRHAALARSISQIKV